MTWSISFIGKPDQVADAIDRAMHNFSGQSFIEYQAAKPHLIALVRYNFVSPHCSYVCPVIEIEASGHGHGREDGEQMNRQCLVSIRPVYKQIV